ncbi:hypothetical protein L915_13378, partial [Phytophthora nicotianae]
DARKWIEAGSASSILSIDFVYIAYNCRVGIAGGLAHQLESSVTNLFVWDARNVALFLISNRP